MRKSGKEVSESPFAVMVVEPEQPYVVETLCDVPIDVGDLNPEDSELAVTLQRPDASDEPVKQTLSDGSLRFSFIPKIAGEHLIAMKKRTVRIEVIETDEPKNEINKPANILLKNIPAEHLPKLHAGLLRPQKNGELAKMEEHLTIKKTTDGNLYVSFFPHEKGPHAINVRKDGISVEDSPYTVDVTEGTVKEEVYPVGRPCDVGLDIPSVNLPHDFETLSATLQRPGCATEEPVILQQSSEDKLRE